MLVVLIDQIFFIYHCMLIILCYTVKYNGPKSLINASEYSKRKLNDSNIQQQTNGTNHSATEKRKRLQPRKIRQEETYSNNFMDCSDTDSEDTR